MSTFLHGDALNDAIDGIIQNAKRFLYITSPYIKLDDHFRERFDLIRNDPDIYLQVLFGKNEDDFYRSVQGSDIDYFKTFPNISIMYEPRLHAKSYVNESEGIITSMNLYDYSAENNIEYGVAFGKAKMFEKVYEDHTQQHMELLEESAHCLFIKRPVYKKTMMGLSKNYIRSETLLDIIENFSLSDPSYQRIVYQDIDIISLTNKEIIPDLKSRSQKRQEERKSKSKPFDNGKRSGDQRIGYCIRTGQEIPFNPTQPLCRDAYYDWVKWRNMDYSESFCHQTGQRSRGRTSMRYPILNSDYKNEDGWN